MLQVNDRLGDFEIIRLLGKGGMGEVYEARQFNPDRRVALKVLAPWLLNDDEALQRFMREAAVPANLDHPGIVRIIATGKTDDGVAYYAMHLVRGISLSEMIRRGNGAPQSDAVTKSLDVGNTPSMAPPPSSDPPPVSPAPLAESTPQFMRDYRADRFTTLARIGAQAARALAYAHQQGFLHRDIKPSNLMVDHHDHVYLVDFGLTRGLQPGADTTGPGTIVGTPWYMSPEQAESKDLDGRSDIYSLGVTLYELATQGLGPFTASRDDKQSVMGQVRTGQTLPLRTLAPGIPHALENIILKAMNLKPHKRHGDAAELARELEAFLGIESKLTPHGHKPAVAPSKRRWPIWAGAAIAVVAITVAVAVAVNGNREPLGPRDPADDVVKPEPPKRKLDGTQAWPDVLRDKHNMGSRVPLLDKISAPRWSEQLFGTGKHSPLKTHVAVSADAMLALADPDMPNFEFAVELAQMGDFEMGIFFGWPRRSKDSNEPCRFFIIKWDENRVGADQHGRVTIGTGWVIKGNATRSDTFGWTKPLPNGKGTVALTQRASKDFWPTLTVNVQGEQVTVTVPNRKPVSFTLAELKRHDPVEYEGLSASGAVGVWCKKGVGLYRNATLTPLPLGP